MEEGCAKPVAIEKGRTVTDVEEWVVVLQVNKTNARQSFP